jgi:hypothetical protein
MLVVVVFVGLRDKGLKFEIKNPAVSFANVMLMDF